MKLPSVEALNIVWKTNAFEEWEALVADVQSLAAEAGKGDLFAQTVVELQKLSRNRDDQECSRLLKTRVGARAITQLWLDDSQFRSRMFTSDILHFLLQAQSLLLGVVPLQNLIGLYFSKFDLLDELEAGLCSELEGVIKRQLSLRFQSSGNSSGHRDLLSVLHDEADWLLDSDGPGKLVRYTSKHRMELEAAFIDFELRGLDSGRYGHICRAHYYLSVLRKLPLGQKHDVFSELLKSTVSKAPYEQGKRIGHVALEILIDRAHGDPGDAWRNFIMEMAGDPRIASTAPNYREWWRPLGEARIEKVRQWLAKFDLRLFLGALEQYGKESGDDALQRMFPARKHFIEGLERQKLVKNTRLMLGYTAERAVRRILGDKLRTSFVRLSNANGMADKAVIFIDCGSFCLVEGSHNFKLWVYLAPPSGLVSSYDVNELSHFELTSKVPLEYRRRYGAGAPYADITHSPTTWQNRVFEFLASHGIGLDIQPLLNRDDYSVYLHRFGMPVVNPRKTLLREVR